MELLRFATGGSVDDGKSTLIGRLLYDSKQIFQDQLEAVQRTSVARGDEYVNLALLTDGLRAEREQGITIDVAYRYFSTPKRRFIIADTPGHTQHTRNMVTGCSTADLVLLLIDARAGATEQTRRHAMIASLLGIRHLVLCVNKMDLVGYSEERFEEIRDDFIGFSERLQVYDLTCIPISALAGDNVVDRSSEMPWYGGLSLLDHLETVHIASDRNLIDLRFPVQLVIRPISSEHHDFRGYAGNIASGVLEVGDEVVALPSGFSSHVVSIDGPEGPLQEAFPPESVVVRLEDDDRHLARRHALPAQQPSQRRPGRLGDGVLDGRETTQGRLDVRDQAHDPMGARTRALLAVPARRERPPSRQPGQRARAERHRPHTSAHDRAAFLR